MHFLIERRHGLGGRPLAGFLAHTLSGGSISPTLGYLFLLLPDTSFRLLEIVGFSPTTSCSECRRSLELYQIYREVRVLSFQGFRLKMRHPSSFPLARYSACFTGQDHPISWRVPYTDHIAVKLLAANLEPYQLPLTHRNSLVGTILDLGTTR